MQQKCKTCEAGAAAPARGRPKVAALAKNRTIKLTDADWAKFRAVGGAKWLREQLAAH